MKSKNGVEPYETKRGTRYKVRFYKPDGSEGSKAGFVTQASAKAFRREMEHSRAQGNFVDPARGKVLLETVARAWLADREKGVDQNAGKLTTLSRITGIVENHIIPSLGKRQIGSLMQSDVDEWVRTLTGEPETIRKAVSVLRGIMKSAVRAKRITMNPVTDLSLPRVVRKRKRYLTHEQVAALQDAVNRTNDGERHGYGLLVALAAYGGFRWSELAGLRLQDVDLHARRVHIDHTIVLVDGKQVSGVPKSYAQREVPIPVFLATLLAKHIERRKVELSVDASTLRKQLARIRQREAKLAQLRDKATALDARVVEVAERRQRLQERLADLRSQRNVQIAAGSGYETLDAEIERAERSLSRLPREDVLALRQRKMPERIARMEKQMQKSPRQKEILVEHLAALKSEPLFAGARTRVWLRNATFRNGWLSPAVKLMDEEALAEAMEEDRLAPRPLGDVEPHELRHTCASLAVSAGANVKVVQALLGHEKASVTLDVYADLFESDLDDVARRMDDIFWRMTQGDPDYSPNASETLPLAEDDPVWR